MADRVMPYARCTTCSAEFTEEELKDATACPSCGSAGKPCDPANDVTIVINWHELRILTIWADNYAQAHVEPDGRRTLDAILRRLHAQHPTMPPLTFGDEMQELADTTGSKVTVLSGDTVETIDPKVRH